MTLSAAAEFSYLFISLHLLHRRHLNFSDMIWFLVISESLTNVNEFLVIH